VYDSQRLANLGIELRWSLKVQLSGSNEVQTLAWWAYRDPLILAVFLVFHATKVRALFHWSSQPNEPERGLRSFEILPLETVSETSSNASIGDPNGDGHHWLKDGIGS